MIDVFGTRNLRRVKGQTLNQEKTMRKLIQRFRRNESGAALAEYAVLVALIAVVAIGTLSLVGTEVNKAFTTIKDQLVTANGKAPASGGGGSSNNSGGGNNNSGGSN